MPIFDGMTHYGLDPNDPRMGKTINYDMPLHPGTVNVASKQAWEQSKSRVGDNFVGVTYLPTNTHYFYPSFTVVGKGKDKRFWNSIGEILTSTELTAIYGNHYISVDKDIPTIGNSGQSALGLNSGIQHAAVAAKAGFAAHPAYFIGWSIVGTKSDFSAQEIRFVSGRNAEKFSGRRRSIDGRDPRELPTSWCDWITRDLIRELKLKERRNSIGYGHNGLERSIAITGNGQIGFIIEKCGLRDHIKHQKILDLKKGQEVFVLDLDEGSKFRVSRLGLAREHLWVTLPDIEDKLTFITTAGWVRKDCVKITSQKPKS